MTRQEQFQEELKALLAKYDVSIDIGGSQSGIEFFSKPESYEDDRTPVGGIAFWCRYFDKDG